LLNGFKLLLVYVDTAVLHCVSAVDQRLVLHRKLIKVGTRRCWRTLVPRIDWRARGWLLRVEHEVLMKIALVVVAVVAVVQIRELRQRLLERGVGKP